MTQKPSSSLGNARLRFLWSAAHTVFPNAPNLSAFYLSEFKKQAVQKNLNLSDVVKRVYCNYCGNLFVPGVSCKVWIGKNGKRNVLKREGQRNRKGKEFKKRREVVDTFNEEDKKEDSGYNKKGADGMLLVKNSICEDKTLGEKNDEMGLNILPMDVDTGKPNKEDDHEKSSASEMGNFKDHEDKEIIDLGQCERIPSEEEALLKTPLKKFSNFRQLIYMTQTKQNSQSSLPSTFLSKSSSLHLPKKAKKKSRLTRKNHVSYLCQLCNRETRWPGSIKLPKRKKEKPKKFQKELINMINPEPISGVVVGDSKANSSKMASPKSSRKKKKKLDLANALNKEKRDYAGDGGGSGGFDNLTEFSLTDFLSSI
ncbi:hypothetical protein G9A89_005221 [Geosiphon pyriformis]|nr:hypothetical protein G9A89_005221 [Geosiphon pyriformis]